MITARVRWVAVSIAIILGMPGAVRVAGTQGVPVPPDSASAGPRANLDKYCVSCHSGGKGAAGISLAEYQTGAEALKARTLWDRVATAVASRHMPPKGMPEPTPAE